LSTVATVIVERAIIYVLEDAAATAGGSVATGTAGGAAFGSWVPGAGTAMGAVAGLLVGVAVDVYMTHNDQERTTKQVIASLTQIEDGIIQGDDKHPGVEKMLDDAALKQSKQLDTKLREQLKEAAK
jgi:hypothetical protein